MLRLESLPGQENMIILLQFYSLCTGYLLSFVSVTKFLGGPQRKPTISDYTDLTKVCHKWRISTWRQPLQPWPSAESRTHRWAPETDLQWGPRHLDIHRGKTPGTSGPLTLWLWCSWNKLLIRLAGGELAPRLSLVSTKVFSPFCHRWSFRSLPLSPLACLVGDTSFPAQSSTWLHILFKLNWAGQCHY